MTGRVGSRRRSRGFQQTRRLGRERKGRTRGRCIRGVLAFEFAIDTEITSLAASGGLRNDAGHRVLDTPGAGDLEETLGSGTNE